MKRVAIVFGAVVVWVALTIGLWMGFNVAAHLYRDHQVFDAIVYGPHPAASPSPVK